MFILAEHKRFYILFDEKKYSKYYAYGSGGWGFESLQVHSNSKELQSVNGATLFKLNTRDKRNYTTGT
jgi:hypothetical protein